MFVSLSFSVDPAVVNEIVLKGNDAYLYSVNVTLSQLIYSHVLCPFTKAKFMASPYLLCIAETCGSSICFLGRNKY